MTYKRVELEAAITAARHLRDQLADLEREANDVGARRLSESLGRLAAIEDSVLARLLQEQAVINTKSQALPGA